MKFGDDWYYDPDDGRGWYVYGQGAVTPDGRQVSPDRGVSVREFTGAMVAPPGLAPGIWGAIGNFFNWGGDPVDLSTGLLVVDKTDLALPDVLPIDLRRTYRPNDARARALGIGATHPYDIFLVGNTFPWTYVELVLPDGARVHYDRISPGTNYNDAVYEHTSTPTPFFKSQVRWNGNGWDLTLKDGTRYVFPESFGATQPQHAALVKIQDRHGNVLSVTRDAQADITRVTAPHGRWVEFTYDASHRVTMATDNIARQVLYEYDASGGCGK